MAANHFITTSRVSVPIHRVDVAAFTVPTEQPESDGTLEWDHTTIVVVHASAGDVAGLGYSYGDVAAAVLRGPVGEVLPRLAAAA